MLGESESALAGVHGPLCAVGGVLSRHGDEAALLSLATIGAQILGDKADVGLGDVLGGIIRAVVAVQVGSLAIETDCKARGTSGDVAEAATAKADRTVTWGSILDMSRIKLVVSVRAEG